MYQLLYRKEESEEKPYVIKCVPINVEYFSDGLVTIGHQSYHVDYWLAHFDRLINTALTENQTRMYRQALEYIQLGIE